jgi:hypothetical protein
MIFFFEVNYDGYFRTVIAEGAMLLLCTSLTKGLKEQLLETPLSWETHPLSFSAMRES